MFLSWRFSHILVGTGGNLNSLDLFMFIGSVIFEWVELCEATYGCFANYAGPR